MDLKLVREIRKNHDIVTLKNLYYDYIKDQTPLKPYCSNEQELKELSKSF